MTKLIKPKKSVKQIKLSYDIIVERLLTEQQRAVLELLLTYEYTFLEIARKLNMYQPNVSRTLTLIIEKFKIYGTKKANEQLYEQLKRYNEEFKLKVKQSKGKLKRKPVRLRKRLWQKKDRWDKGIWIVE